MLKVFFISVMFLLSFDSNSQETYKVGNTEYYQDRYYSTTGEPMVKRSGVNKASFLNSIGLIKTPNGYEIDHIIPLSEGGTDEASNMQLLTVDQHKIKTAKERAARSNPTYSSFPKFESNTQQKYHYLYSDSSNQKTIYTGSRGGKYYINSNGNKTYIKQEK